jgi:tRNA-splicing ligase RtcB
MNKVIATERIPIKLWLDNIEPGAFQQAKNLANLPFSFRHISIMPDAHQGYGMPIGGVMATKDVIIPNAVGVDIGCGMCAVRTNLTEIGTQTLRNIRDSIIDCIPVGFNHQEKPQDGIPVCEIDVLPIVSENYDKAKYQLGTLGGGNHFIEIQRGNDGYIWIMVHSGSRNLGFKVGNHYNKIARQLNQRWYSSVPDKWELAFLPWDSEHGINYYREMRYCVEFAYANRNHMLDVIKHIFDIYCDVSFEDPINIAHNYAVWEHHFKQNVLVHRKGATKASDQHIGIIPGSQGTKSYIVRGLGNKESFYSCSHGAGRKMGRKQAKRELDLTMEQEKLKGILHSVDSIDKLDEASGAYKDIDVVMENQKDLVEIIIELEPLAVVKG